MTRAGIRWAICAVALCTTFCGGEPRPEPEAAADAEPAAVEAEAEAEADLGSLPSTVAPVIDEWTGDLGGMIERRRIRALVVPTRTQYWIDRGQQVGVEYELLKAFEEEVNRAHPSADKNVKIHVVFVPVARNELIPALLAGRGDLAAGVLTITPERQAQVDFGAPYARDVAEIAVAGPQSPAVAALADLAGQEVFVRRSSSYWGHLETLSARFESEGRPPIRLRAAPEDLQDDDLLEMVNAGLVGLTVVDRYAALLWAKVFTDLRPLEEVVVHSGGEIAWMMRKGSPELKAAVDAFAAGHGKGTLFGNTVIKKYTGSTRFAKPATSAEERAKLERMAELFRTYGDQYQLDFLLMAAQGYQESRLDQDARSHVGAIGVMQVMPATGAELAVGDIQQLEPNIHAGVKYIRQIIDRYFDDPAITEVDKGLLAFAAYNCGPARVRRLRTEAAERGLDPNRWFNNVELIAAERIGSETVTYVSNIYKYYIAYQLVMEQRAAADAAREEAAPGR